MGTSAWRGGSLNHTIQQAADVGEPQIRLVSLFGAFAAYNASHRQMSPRAECTPGYGWLAAKQVQSTANGGRGHVLYISLDVQMGSYRFLMGGKTRPFGP